MKVDFNNVRRCAVEEYNSLVKILNAHIVHGNTINVDAEDLTEVLDDLRMSIATIALSYEEGNEDIKDVLGDNVLELFNKESEG